MDTGRIVFFVACIGFILYKLWSDFFHKKEKNAVDEEIIAQEFDSKRKEDLQLTLDSVNSWINNCDQKAGILLAIVGVAITVLITSDFLKHLRNYIFIPFVEYCNNESSDLTFSLSRFTVFVFLIISVLMLVTSCFYLLQAISANIDYDEMRKKHPGMVKSSYIFFGSICKMSYDEFKKDEVNYLDDLRSQIYVNSEIANSKFKYYNKGLCWFKFMLLASVMLFISVMFVQ